MMRKRRSAALRGGRHGLAIATSAMAGVTASPAGAAEQAGLPSLPHDLSPWGMFLNPDRREARHARPRLRVARHLDGVARKTLELVMAKRAARRGLATLLSAPSLESAVRSTAPGRAQLAQFLDAAAAELRTSASLPAEGVKERIAASLSRCEARAGRAMMRCTGLLATIGTTAPFVGLFGTVWGIMNSFISIAKSNTSNLAVVAPGIAEALLATAAGLVAAIPAVMIYNVFARAIAGYKALLADAAAEIMRHVSRDLDWTDAGRDRKVQMAAPVHPAERGAMALDLAASDAEPDELHDVNVTPFIDVILVLLIIFIVAAPLSTSDVPVDLPSASAPPSPRPDKPVFVTLKTDGSLALGDEAVSREALGSALDQRVEGDHEQRIYLRADKGAVYGDVMAVMNLLRQSDYLKIGLVGLEAPVAPMPEAQPTR